ncbi:MAG: VanZ family protein [Arthrobacter sp.]|jgi:glycopeptide antibiotics resistance protein|nr:VanZ family protein [Arthrobacter sp.]
MDLFDSPVLWPALVAVLFGGVALAVSGVFLLALQYRRFGALSLGRTVATAGLVIYAMAIGTYTMLPLPVSKAASCAAGTGGLALDPMGPVHELREAFAHGVSAGLHSGLFWQLALNVLLFIPLGVLGVRLLGWHPIATVLFGFGVSLAIEATQYTGLFGLFCRYRVADVGDLITNTLGALIGVLLALTPLFGWIKTPQQLEDQARRRPVTRGRRLWGMIFDLAFVGAASFAAALLAQLAVDPFVLRVLSPAAPALRWLSGAAWLLPLLVVLVPVLGPRRTTFGQRCVWIDAARLDGSRAPLWQALLRVAFGLGGYTLLVCLQAANPQGPAWLDTASSLWTLATLLFLLFDRSARGISYRVAALAPSPRASRHEPAPR